jgi:glutaredoxin
MSGVTIPPWFERWLPTIAATYKRSRVYRWATHAMLVLLPLAVVLSGYIQWQKIRHDPRRQPAGQVTLIVGQVCPFSRELERAMQAAGISYRRLDIDDGDADGPARWAYYTLHARGIPVTIVGDQVVYGLRTGAIRAELDHAGIDTARLAFTRETEGAITPRAR